MILLINLEWCDCSDRLIKQKRGLKMHLTIYRSNMANSYENLEKMVSEQLVEYMIISAFSRSCTKVK